MILILTLEPKSCKSRSCKNMQKKGGLEKHLLTQLPDISGLFVKPLGDWPALHGAFKAATGWSPWIFWPWDALRCPAGLTQTWFLLIPFPGCHAGQMQMRHCKVKGSKHLFIAPGQIHKPLLKRLWNLAWANFSAISWCLMEIERCGCCGYTLPIGVSIIYVLFRLFPAGRCTGPFRKRIGIHVRFQDCSIAFPLPAGRSPSNNGNTRKTSIPWSAWNSGDFVQSYTIYPYPSISYHCLLQAWQMLKKCPKHHIQSQPVTSWAQLQWPQALGAQDQIDRGLGVVRPAAPPQSKVGCRDAQEPPRPTCLKQHRYVHGMVQTWRTLRPKREP